MSVRRPFWKAPGGEWTWAAIYTFALGAYATYMGLTKSYSIHLAIGPMFLASGACIWLGLPIGRLIGITTALAFTAISILILVQRGFSWPLVLGGLCGIWLAWNHWRDLKSPPDADEPMVSLVLFLEAPRYLEAPVLANIVSAAWGGKYSGIASESELNDRTDAEGDPSRFVVGESPIFAIQSPSGFFILHNFDRPYFEDVEKAAASLKDLRVRRAVEKSRAWLAVDAMKAADPAATAETLYPQIARLIAELAGPDCLAILQPQTGRINAWDESLEQSLRGPKALEEFSVPVNPPVVQVKDDDPAMQAAVSEARRRWPEFVNAFQKKDGESFSVKAPITGGGNTEFIWVTVDGLEPEYIHGRLGNEPVDLGGMKLGDRVEVPVAELNDWMFVKNGEWIGLFTRKAMTGS